MATTNPRTQAAAPAKTMAFVVQHTPLLHDGVLHMPGDVVDLTAAQAFQTLLNFGDKDLSKLAFERDRSLPGQAPAANSRLWRLLTRPNGHQHVQLDAASRARLALWMDTYAQRQGHYSSEQESQLRQFRQQQAFLTQPNSP